MTSHRVQGKGDASLFQFDFHVDAENHDGHQRVVARVSRSSFRESAANPLPTADRHRIDVDLAAQRQFQRLQQLQGVDCCHDRWAGMLSHLQPFYG